VPLKTLDRSIAWQYLVNALALLLLLNAFVILTSVSLKFEDFLQAASGQANLGATHRALSALLLVVDLWWPRVIQLFVFMNGFVLVGAMGFTFAQLVKHRELVAMMASGIPLWRAARPVVVVALAFLGLQVVAQEVVIPQIAPLLSRGERDAGKRDFSSFRVNLVPDGQNRVFMARAFDPALGVATGVYVLERDQSGRAEARITADKGVWDAGLKAWKLENGQQRTLRAGAGGAGGGQQVVPIALLRSTVDPSALLSHQYRQFSQTLSSVQLIEAVNMPGLPADVKERMSRMFWGRWSGLLATVLTMVIVMPFFLMREPGNMVTQSIKAAPVALGCLVAGVLGSAAPVPAEILPVALSAFIPCLVMLPVAIAQGTGIRT